MLALLPTGLNGRATVPCAKRLLAASRWAVSLLAAVALLLPAALGAEAAGKKARHAEKLDPSKSAQELLRLHNKERARENRSALQLNDKLTAAAQKYAERLARENKFSHTVGGGMSDRVRAEGYRFRSLGENIAKGQSTPASAVKSWMHSPGHRANILGKGYRDVGFGVARDGGSLVWVADFGSR